MAEPALQLVASTQPTPPYAPDTRAMGWVFELDLERVSQSDTWVLAAPDMRPWLLMLWATAWRQVPCGSLSPEDALIAARIGMDPRLFQAHRDMLLRGWRLHADGRLYHAVITEHVLAMLNRRRDGAKRQRAYLERKAAEREEAERLDMTGDASVTRHTRVSDASTTTTTTTTTKGIASPDGDACAPGSAPAAPEPHPEAFALEPAGAATSNAYKAPACPIDQIVNAYHDALPMLPRCEVLNASRRRQIAARWREVVSAERWGRDKGLEWFAWFFAHVSASKFLTGRARAQRDARAFRADLDWLTGPINFAKVVEGRYHDAKQGA